MPKEFQNFQTVQFLEHPITDMSQYEPHVFDVSTKGFDFPPSFTSKGDFLMEIYCQLLTRKIQNISKNDISDLIDYQCSLLKSPLVWLDQLETLLELNFSIFENNCHKSRIHKLYIIIQFKRQELKSKLKSLKNKISEMDEVASTEMVKFDFRTVKYDLNNLTSYEEKKAYLIELEADYLQSEPYMSWNNNKPFNKLIEIEMDKLEKLENIKKSFHVKDKVINNSNKIRINGNLNVFVDIFYQMLFEVKTDNLPFLDYSPSVIAEFIINNFVDKDGREISISTVRTILSPGKIDKRPSYDKRIKVKP